MDRLLDSINSPQDLRKLTREQLPQLAHEIRCLILDVVERNGGHLASSLGVVELTLVLHYLHDFSRDRLVWDVGHQAYAHKILTGRRDSFHTLRTVDGMSGFPNRFESPYDPFTTGHAGASLSTALGLLMGMDRMRGLQKGGQTFLSDQEKTDRQECLSPPTADERPPRVVAVIGDASIATGIAFEALNHAGDSKNRLMVVLNDNRMAIADTVGALSKHLNRVRTSPRYAEMKREVRRFIDSVPALGPRMEKAVERLKDLVRHAVVPGWLFEEFGFRYFGPVDGHNIGDLIDTFAGIENLSLDIPVLVHVLTQKGRGHDEACLDPCKFHGLSPAVLADGKTSEETPVPDKPSYTKIFSRVIADLAWERPEICAITAAMPDGTGLAEFQKSFPERLIDVGICEQHAVALAGGLASAGLKPVVAVYSTFLQRGYDQIFHDVCLQKVPVIFAVDRAGLVGSDGPTHHGAFDIAYMRHLPGMMLMAPADARELEAMFRFAATLDGPAAVRYPRAAVPDTDISPDTPIELGKSAVAAEGTDGTLFAYGAMVDIALDARAILKEQGLAVKVIDARFAKPLDVEALARELEEAPFVLTLEEGSAAGGFGSAALEAMSARGADVRRLHVAGIPDRFIEHGPRSELLRRIGLDAAGVARTAAQLHEEPVRSHHP